MKRVLFQKNPKYNHIAVGEYGSNPPIVIYEWPSFEQVCTLHGGSTKGYVHLTYNVYGTLLCSQADEPDYFITIWDWLKKQPQVRVTTKETFNVEFSRFVSQQLMSCGVGHITFWDIVQTFSGLKLQGTKGQFGSVDFSDIVGVYAMPDKKFVSGCAWGNILLWSDNRILFEVSQKDRVPCHAAPISQFEYSGDDNELITVGMDGFIKMWYYGAIQEAEIADEHTVLEVTPMFEISVSDERGQAQLLSIVKKNGNSHDFVWFAQDGNGGLWELDLEVSANAMPPRRLYSCHSGKVTALSACPDDYYIVTVDDNGMVHVYDVMNKELIAFRQFSASGHDVIWMPSCVKSSSSVIVGGFGDGTVQVLVVLFSELDNSIKVTQTVKPHLTCVSALSVNVTGSILVSGSRDKTIFVFQILSEGKFLSLVPIGYVQLDSPTVYMNWKPEENNTVLVSCEEGIHEVLLPNQPQALQPSSVSSFHLSTSMKTITLDSILNEFDKKFAIVKKLKLTSMPGRRLTRKIKFFSKISMKSKIIMAEYITSELIWLSLTYPDWGYIYTYDVSKNMCGQQVKTSDAEETEINVYRKMKTGDLCFLGLSNGNIWVVKTNTETLCDFSDCWQLPVHDYKNGKITSVCVSHDQRFIYTCGFDGNVFVFEMDIGQDHLTDLKTSHSLKHEAFVAEEVIENIPETTYLNLEEKKKEEECNQKKQLAAKHKAEVYDKLAVLKEKYVNLLERNSKLPQSQMLPTSFFRVHPAIQMHVQKFIQTERELVHKQMAFEIAKTKLNFDKIKKYFIEPLAAFKVEVFSIRTGNSVTTFKHKSLCNEFIEAERVSEELMKKVEIQKAATSSEIYRIQRTPAHASSSGIGEPLQVPTIQPYLLIVKDFYSKLNIKTKRALEKHQIYYKKKLDKQKQWQEFMETRPDANKSIPEDVAAIEYAQKNIGDYKLKSSRGYRVPDRFYLSVLGKYAQLLRTKREIYTVKENFNKKVYELREEKIKLLEKYKFLQHKLEEIHNDLDAEDRICCQALPRINIQAEFPEMQFQVNPRRLNYLNVASTTWSPPEVETFDKEFYNFCRNQNIIGKSESDQLKMTITEVDSATLLEVFKCDISEWENDLRQIHVKRQKFKQEKILDKLNELVNEYDKRVALLKREKINLSIDVKFLEIYMLVLHQELLVVQSYSERETKVTKQLSAKLKEKHGRLLKMNVIHNKIEAKITEITQLKEKCLETEKAFLETTVGNKLSKYYTKVYRRQYRLPKRRKSSDTSSSITSGESTSSSSDDDSGNDGDGGGNGNEEKYNLKHRKHVDIRLSADFNEDIYDRVVQLRAERHKLEADIAKEIKVVERLEREQVTSHKILKIVEPVLRINQEQLDSIQDEKLRKINNLETIVLVRCSQLENLTAHGKLNKLKNCLLFPKKKLKVLEDRVTQLLQETDMESTKCRKNQKYYQRLNEECCAVKNKISKLRKEIKEAKIKKFGQELDVEVLEEKVLRKMIEDVQNKMKEEDVKKYYDVKIVQLKEKLMLKSEELAKVQNENTHKLTLLSSLQEELQKLTLIIQYQESQKAKWSANEAIFEEYNEDCTKLIEVLKSLQSQKEMIVQEIKLLRMKAQPLPPISPLPSQQMENHLSLLAPLSSDKIVAVKQPEHDIKIGEGSDEVNDDAVDHNKATGTDDDGNNSDDNDVGNESSNNDNDASEDSFEQWHL